MGNIMWIRGRGQPPVLCMGFWWFSFFNFQFFRARPGNLLFYSISPFSLRGPSPGIWVVVFYRAVARWLKTGGGARRQIREVRALNKLNVGSSIHVRSGQSCTWSQSRWRRQSRRWKLRAPKKGRCNVVTPHCHSCGTHPDV
ncbi:hypothetical protein GQ53DRAFT_514130 [Thozetella sp. PMI_491]|nr:hypothetical protein GQ53DRAFT_514130 [Thozetella sp. PMI_491]